MSREQQTTGLPHMIFCASIIFCVLLGIITGALGLVAFNSPKLAVWEAGICFLASAIFFAVVLHYSYELICDSRMD